MRPNIFLKGRSGIYGIRNVVNNKIYVGKTKCMYTRCHQYVYDFRERSLGHLNDYLFNAMRSAGIDAFEFFPLEFCEIQDCAEKELLWMTKLSSTKRESGYNLRMDSSTGMIVAAETSEKIRRNLKRQWSSGIRDAHGDKLKESWKLNPARRDAQSRLLSKIKTKYEYEITSPDGLQFKCDYAKLRELCLQNCMSTFHRTCKNEVKYKGYVIRRAPKGEL